MNTIVYIDGFNFYYGLLKSGPYKWLDFQKLFVEEIIPSIEYQPTSLIIKLFSSNIKANFHRRGEAAAHAQSTYFRALKQHIGEGKIEIIYGDYLTSPQSAYPFDSEQSPKKPHTFESTKVWKIEEKLTDVQLALSIYRDASKGICQQAIICTNDSDISPALAMTKCDFPQTILGVVIPIKAEKADCKT